MFWSLLDTFVCQYIFVWTPACICSFETNWNNIVSSIWYHFLF
jgi:hypothetical protein